MGWEGVRYNFISLVYVSDHPEFIKHILKKILSNAIGPIYSLLQGKNNQEIVLKCA